MNSPKKIVMHNWGYLTDKQHFKKNFFMQPETTPKIGLKIGGI